MEDNKGYKKLKIWIKADELTFEIYKIIKNFPKEEMYGIISQLRRAAYSVPLNIVEGHASNSKKEFLNFLNIANRSLVETEYLLELSLKFCYLDKNDYEKLEGLRQETGRMLNDFMASLKNKL